MGQSLESGENIYQLDDGGQTLYQWDTGLRLAVGEDVYRVDYCYRVDPKIIYGVLAENGFAEIPDVLLQRYGILDIMVMSRTKTIRRVEVPVIERPMPAGYLVTERGTVITYEELENVFKRLHYASTEGFTMSGNIDMAGYKIGGLVEPVDDDEAVRKRYVDKNFMKTSGATVTGRFDGFLTPEKGDEPATKEYVDSETQKINTLVTAHHKIFRVTVPRKWNGAGPYTQDVAVEGLMATDAPHVTAVYDSDRTTAISQADSWACVSQAEALDNALRLVCLQEMPEMPLNLVIEVNR